MYDEEKASEEKGSMQLAQICLEEMTAALGSTSKGIVKDTRFILYEQQRCR